MSRAVPTESVIATLGYVKAFAGQTILIKLGGAALQDEALVRSICDDLTLIRSVGVSLVLVHGGGPSINEELTSKNIRLGIHRRTEKDVARNDGCDRDGPLRAGQSPHRTDLESRRSKSRGPLRR